jgi:shikimate kinase
MKDLNKLEENKEKHRIALIGHMGSGKTAFGKLISKKLNLNFYDSDRLIEKQKMRKINELFHIYGEATFRTIEEETILSIPLAEKMVLSLGGGAILNKKVRNFLKKNFTTVFLDVNISLITERLKKSYKRPLLLNTNIEKKIKELDLSRRKYYLLADIKIKNSNDLDHTFLNFIFNYKKLNDTQN